MRPIITKDQKDEVTSLYHKTKSEEGAMAFWPLNLRLTITELIITHCDHCIKQSFNVFHFLIHLFHYFYYICFENQYIKAQLQQLTVTSLCFSKYDANFLHIALTNRTNWLHFHLWAYCESSLTYLELLLFGSLESELFSGPIWIVLWISHILFVIFKDKFSRKEDNNLAAIRLIMFGFVWACSVNYSCCCSWRETST